MRLQPNLFSLLVLPSVCTSQGTNGDENACPCFSSTTLNYFTTENTSDTSCKGFPQSLFIWKVRDPNNWHPNGYGVRLQPTSCLYEGDIMRLIEPEEASLCLDLIQKRCEELGLLVNE
jgi:hypothetical protein